MSINDILKKVLPEDRLFLLTTKNHPDIFLQIRSQNIISRVRLIAIIFTFFPLIRFLIEVFILPSFFHFHISFRLEIGLLVVAGGFATLGLILYWKPKSINYRLAIIILLLIPSGYFLFSRFILSYGHLNAASTTVSDIDLFLPFVIVSLMSVFPLVFLEFIAFSTILITTLSIPSILNFSSIPSSINNFAIPWYMFLVGVIGLIASISQLHASKTIFLQASTDHLTKLYNRRYGENILTLFYTQAKRHQHPLSVAFFDLDNFKSINDKWGHEVGDEILQNIATFLKLNIRSEDVVIRWGGEEFVVLMPYATIQQATNRLDKILKTTLVPNSVGVSVTMSGGICEIWNDNIKDEKSLIQLADSRMYNAKASGKNQIIAS